MHPPVTGTAVHVCTSGTCNEKVCLSCMQCAHAYGGHQIMSYQNTCHKCTHQASSAENLRLSSRKQNRIPEAAEGDGAKEGSRSACFRSLHIKIIAVWTLRSNTYCSTHNVNVAPFLHAVPSCQIVSIHMCTCCILQATCINIEQPCLGRHELLAMQAEL